MLIRPLLPRLLEGSFYSHEVKIREEKKVEN